MRIYKSLIPGLVLTAFSNTLMAETITYRDHIQPLWQAKCAACHGANAPYVGEFDANEEKYVAQSLGPRMDTYAELMAFVAWPDTGALMRRLDDGTASKEGRPGNMHPYLGETDEERRQNLALFKAWIGEQGWTLKRAKDITLDELRAIQAEY